MATFNMSGLIAVVTGGGTGLGLAMATGLAKNGAKVYITGRRAQILEKVAKDFQGPGSLVPLQMDVTDEESIKKGVQLLTEKEGKLDILINNAGTNIPPNQPDRATKGLEYFSQEKLPYELETFEGWSYMFRLNALAPFFVTTAFLDLLTKGAHTTGRQTSIVINIGSIAALQKTPYPGNSISYPITKHTLQQMSLFLASDFAQRKIPVRVVALAPGLFASDMTEGALAPDLDAIAKTTPPGYVAPIPLLRIGKPEELSLTTNYLVTNEYVNGVVLPIDGGFSLVNL